MIALLAAAVMGLSAPSTPKYSGYLDDPNNVEQIIPPQKYWGNTVVVTVFLTADQIEQACGDKEALACVSKEDNVAVMYMMNPCPLKVGHQELYAAITCHEIGHVNGWPHDHGPK